MTKIYMLAVMLCLMVCNVNAQYCTPSGSNAQGINNFQISGIINYGSPVNVPYSFYPPDVFTTWMTIGQDYTVQISSDDFIVDHFKLWIDLNNDRQFSDSEMLIDDEGTISDLITIPNNPSFVGLRRLRVMVGSYENFNACGWSGSDVGEAEDYLVHITDSLVPTAYCRPLPNNPVAFPILNFKFNTLHNCGSEFTPTGYIEYPDSVFTTEVEIGKKYPIYMSKESAGVTGAFAAFIDYNDNHLFDYNEKIFQRTGTTYGSGEIMIRDDSTVVGRHLLRARSRWAAGGLDGCYADEYSSSETEDYWITIIPAVPDTDTIVPPPANRWRLMYGLPDKQEAMNAMESYDQGYLLTGFTGDTYTPFELKLSIDGDTLWSKTYSTAEGRYPIGMDTTRDGGYVHCGVSWEAVPYGGSYIMKANACGDKEWSINYGENYEYHWMEDVFQLDNGDYLATTHYFSETFDNYVNRFGLVRVDTTGNLLWSRNYSEYFVHDMDKSLLTSDGCVLINSAAYLPVPWDTTYYYLRNVMLKVDQNGNVVWKNVFDTVNQVSAYTIVSTEVPGKGYLSAGYVWDTNDVAIPSTFMTSFDGQMKWVKPLSEDDFIKYTVVDIARIENNLYAVLASRYDACDPYDYRTSVITIDSSGNVLNSTWEGVVKNWPASISATSNGKILVFATNMPGEYQSSFFVMKYNTDLTFDTLYNVTLHYDSICESITPVKQIDLPADPLITIYPNPASRYLSVEVHNLNNYALMLYDAQGRLLHNSEGCTEGKTIIDLAPQKPGIYLLMVKTNEGVWTRKVVLMK
ncbi:MAG TPA: T9SS type A sorting domain-containing protein [Lentimicrobium sp.]|nr:T9SS type A sorting domain-containing protein [Lentimicrobium sp.]